VCQCDEIIDRHLERCREKLRRHEDIHQPFFQPSFNFETRPSATLELRRNADHEGILALVGTPPVIKLLPDFRQHLGDQMALRFALTSRKQYPDAREVELDAVHDVLIPIDDLEKGVETVPADGLVREVQEIGVGTFAFDG
jgi:hypothetical protein